MLNTVRKCFPLLLGLIVAVSLYDTFLIVCFKDTIERMEENPIGLWLLRVGDGDVEIFVRAKLAGTILVAATLVYLNRRGSWSVVPVTTSVAAWQVGLFAYLTLA